MPERTLLVPVAPPLNQTPSGGTQYLAGALADVGPVEVETDAAGQHLCFSLAEARVGAGGAGLGTVKAGLDALHQRWGLLHCRAVRAGPLRSLPQRQRALLSQGCGLNRVPLADLLADV